MHKSDYFDGKYQTHSRANNHEDVKQQFDDLEENIKTRDEQAREVQQKLKYTAIALSTFFALIIIGRVAHAGFQLKTKTNFYGRNQKLRKLAIKNFSLEFCQNF